MKGERNANVYFLPAINNPTKEQLHYFLMRAAFLDDVFEAGGMTAEQASLERSLILGRVGMNQMLDLLRPDDSVPDDFQGA